MGVVSRQWPHPYHCHLRPAYRIGCRDRLVAGALVRAEGRDCGRPAICRHLQLACRICSGDRAGPHHGAGVESAALVQTGVAQLSHLVVGVCGALPVGSFCSVFGRFLAFVLGGGSAACGESSGGQAQPGASAGPVAARFVTAATGAVRGNCTLGTLDQPAGVAAILCGDHTACADRRLAGAALPVACSRLVLVGGCRFTVGVMGLDPIVESVATLVAGSELGDASQRRADPALVRLAPAKCSPAVVARGRCPCAGRLARSDSLAIAGTGRGTGVVGADHQRESRHSL